MFTEGAPKTVIQGAELGLRDPQRDGVVCANVLSVHTATSQYEVFLHHFLDDGYLLHDFIRDGLDHSLVPLTNGHQSFSPALPPLLRVLNLPVVLNGQVSHVQKHRLDLLL